MTSFGNAKLVDAGTVQTFRLSGDYPELTWRMYFQEVNGLYIADDPVFITLGDSYNPTEQWFPPDETGTLQINKPGDTIWARLLIGEAYLPTPGDDWWVWMWVQDEIEKPVRRGNRIVVQA